MRCSPLPIEVLSLAGGELERGQASVFVLLKLQESHLAKELDKVKKQVQDILRKTHDGVRHAKQELIEEARTKLHRQRKKCEQAFARQKKSAEPLTQVMSEVLLQKIGETYTEMPEA